MPNTWESEIADRIRPLRQVPAGVQCFVGDEARCRRSIEEKARAVFEGWDYQEIIPPLFDYAEVFKSEALAPKTYSFVGRDGSLLALRPDFTSLLAKIVANRLSQRPTPIRLYYSGEVLRYEPPKAGRQSELYQMGLERLGGDRATADVEVLAIAAECLEALGVRGWVLAVGHVGVFTALVAACGFNPETVDELRDRVESKDAAGIRAMIRSARADGLAGEALAQLATLAGDASVLDAADRLLRSCAPARAALAELQRVARSLDVAGLGAKLAIDLGEVRGLDYYTGLVFRIYAPGLGFEVGGGGRYDDLLARFGRPLPAIGFMLGLDRLALLLERQNILPTIVEAPVHTLGTDDLGTALAEARQRRASGGRIRFGNGATP